MRTGKPFYFPRRGFGWGKPISYKEKEAEIYGKWAIRFGVFFIAISIIGVALGIYSEFN